MLTLVRLTVAMDERFVTMDVRGFRFEIFLDKPCTQNDLIRYNGYMDLL
jgi:hypothetical protein